MNALLLHTPGEPAGIGPELVLRLAQQPTPACRVVIADGELLRRTARHLNLEIELRPFEGDRPATPARVLWHFPQSMPTPVEFGQPSPRNAAYLLGCLSDAVALANQAHSAIITGPLHKASINASGIAFSGHTEFLAACCGSAVPVMLLVAGGLRVALATTHLPLRQVPDAITAQSLRHCLRVLTAELRQRFGIASPRIQVCGLNPHAGEGGHLGQEEEQTIAPVIKEFRAVGHQLTGPVPADTAFTRERLAQCDAVLAMYHDQGLPTLKHAGFGTAVNVTLGLPIIRTSVDHGTAFDIAGQGIADLGSLKAAELLARELAGRAA